MVWPAGYPSERELVWVVDGDSSSAGLNGGRPLMEINDTGLQHLEGSAELGQLPPPN